jgi:hypothetical protein
VEPEASAAASQFAPEAGPVENSIYNEHLQKVKKFAHIVNSFLENNGLSEADLIDKLTPVIEAMAGSLSDVPRRERQLKGLVHELTHGTHDTFDLPYWVKIFAFSLSHEEGFNNQYSLQWNDYLAINDMDVAVAFNLKRLIQEAEARLKVITEEQRVAATQQQRELQQREAERKARAAAAQPQQPQAAEPQQQGAAQVQPQADQQQQYGHMLAANSYSVTAIATAVVAIFATFIAAYLSLFNTTNSGKGDL